MSPVTHPTRVGTLSSHDVRLAWRRSTVLGRLEDGGRVDIAGLASEVEAWRAGSAVAGRTVPATVHVGVGETGVARVAAEHIPHVHHAVVSAVVAAVPVVCHTSKGTRGGRKADRVGCC